MKRFSMRNSLFQRTACLSLLVIVFCLGCDSKPAEDAYAGLIVFNDDVASNSQPDPSQLNSIVLTRADGMRLQLSDIQGERNILLVISRGLVGSIPTGDTEEAGRSFCIYCTTQTSRLVANYSEFKSRNTEVVVLFPVAKKADAVEIQKFAANVLGTVKTTDDLPFPIFLDIELLAVDALGIRDDLSKPSTYIIDTSGQLRFGYVGQSMSDRPSIQALLDQLDQINN